MYIYIYIHLFKQESKVVLSFFQYIHAYRKCHCTSKNKTQHDHLEYNTPNTTKPSFFLLTKLPSALFELRPLLWSCSPPPELYRLSGAGHSRVP